MGRTSDARDRLVAAARGLIATGGYHQVGVSDICADAGVRKGSFYYFFDSKQALAAEAITAHWAEERARWQAILGAQAPAAERLRALCHDMERSVAAGRKATGAVTGCTLGNLALEVSAVDPVLRARLAEVFDEQVALVAGVLADRSAADGASRDDGASHDDVARAIVAQIEGLIMFAKLRDDAGVMTDLWPSVARLAGIPATAPV